jgi:hypothetical protein
MKTIRHRLHRKAIAIVNGAVVLSCLATVGLGQPFAADTQSGFSERSIRGCYIEALSGTVLLDPADPSVQLPIASLIRFCADGKGAAWVSGTQNIGGSCIIEQQGTATYSMDRSGTGTVTATLQNNEVSPGCAPLTAIGDTATFELRFGLQRLGGCLQTIGTGLVLQGNQTVVLPFVSEGQACPER